MRSAHYYILAGAGACSGDRRRGFALFGSESAFVGGTMHAPALHAPASQAVDPNGLRSLACFTDGSSAEPVVNVVLQKIAGDMVRTDFVRCGRLP